MTPAEQAATLKVGDVICRGGVDFTLQTVGHLAWAKHLVMSGRWVKVEIEGKRK